MGFVHDENELVIESPADNRVPDRAAEIKDLMRQGMSTIAPGMVVKVETVVARLLNKADLDPRYLPEVPIGGPAIAAAPDGYAPNADVSGRETGSPARSP